MYGDIPYSNTLRYSDTLITRHIHFLNLYVDTVYIYMSHMSNMYICRNSFPRVSISLSSFSFSGHERSKLSVHEVCRQSPRDDGETSKTNKHLSFVSRLGPIWQSRRFFYIFCRYFVIVFACFSLWHIQIQPHVCEMARGQDRTPENWVLWVLPHVQT